MWKNKKWIWSASDSRETADTVSFLHLTGCFLQLTMYGIEKGKRNVYSVGEVKKDTIMGKAWVRIYPFDNIGVIRHE